MKSSRGHLAWRACALVALLAATALPGSIHQKHPTFPSRETSLPAPAVRARVLEQYAQLPLYFEPNLGQTDAEVRFVARASGYTMFLTASEAVMVLSGRMGGPARSPQPKSVAREQAVVRMAWEGCSRTARIRGLERQPGVSAYFLGNDPSKWQPEVPHYRRVEYKGIYPGVDLIYHGDRRQMEYDFVVGPGADPRQIRLAYTGVERLRVDEAGDLVLATRLGELKQHKPRVYQQSGAGRVEIAATYQLKGRVVGVQVAAYDRGRPLVVDPVLSYSSYLGGSGYDYARSIAVDATGAAYVVGATASTNFPAANAYQASGGSYDAFVTKLNPYGGSGAVSLAYSTYLGGSGSDGADAVAVGSAGALYVAGQTSSTNFPTANAYQASSGGAVDAFVTKLNPYGGSGAISLAYSTYLGGSGYDFAWSIAVNAVGAAYVAGETGSTNFPTANAYQASSGGTIDAFVAKLNPYGGSGAVSLAYSTYLGGSYTDSAVGIAVDAAGAAYVAGGTTSFNFPVINAYPSSCDVSNYDGFVTKLNSYGGSGAVTLAYSTCLGGSGYDSARSIAVDATGAAYVAGQTGSTNFPVVNAYQASFGGGIYPNARDAFVTKLNSYAGSGTVTLAYSTFLGGSGDDVARGIAVDATGAAYVAGETTSSNFPTANAYQQLYGGGVSDTFVTKLNSYGGIGTVSLAYSTYLGGSGYDSANGIAVQATGAAYVVGFSFSTNFPTANAYQSSPGGDNEAFVAKLTEPLRFVPVTPCRVADTRASTNKLGFTGARDLPIAGLCGVPASARAYSLNVSAIPRTASLGFLAIWPAGQPQPVVSTLNSFDARVKANAALVHTGTNGAVSVFVSDTSDVFLDINGYFAPAATAPDALAYYPLPPCRVADTRAATGKAGFSGTRTIPLRGLCGLPAGAEAYAVNFTVLPRAGPFSFLSAWPTGQPQPGVSTLNAFTGAVTANAAIVPAGAGGSVDVYHTEAADLLVDVNGYFAPPGAGGLSFYGTTPCRAVDTRAATSKLGFSGTRDFPLPAGDCNLPVASAYSLNATVLPRPTLDFLSLWATGGVQPAVSTLNSFDGSVVSNAALVPASTAGSITAYHTQAADLLLDVNGYFAP